MARLETLKFWLPAVGFGLYFAVLVALGDLVVLHLIFGGTVVALFYLGEKPRHFLKHAWPMLAAPLVYDLLRYGYKDFITGSVNVAEPYFFEKAWFGILTDQGRVTLNEFFEIWHHSSLDAVCGFVYIIFVFEIMAMFLYLYWKKYFKAAWLLSLSFLLVNLLGFVTYFVYPAAPPWYVAQYGLGPALMNVHASPAGALRFDTLIGIPIFQNFYGQSNDVFGAMPSLHVSYPLLVVFVSFMTRQFRGFTLLFLGLMCFSAVYLQHHYVIDVIMGAIYAALVYIPLQRFYSHRPALEPVSSV